MTIPKISEDLRIAVQAELNGKTKPLGSLGRIEDIALQIALIQGDLKPKLTRPAMLILAGDHGIAKEGVSPFPQEVTGAMVHNFATGGAAINVFTRQLGWQLELIDCGTVSNAVVPGVLSLNIGRGTQNFLEAPAMSAHQRERCFAEGAARVQHHATAGTNVIGFGEMGIGNTSAAALLIHCLSDLPLEVCVNRGAGCDDAQLQRKFEILERALKRHGRITDPQLALQTYGGFEIAVMTASMLEAARLGMVVLVDGIIASSAALIAIQLDPQIKPYLIFAHQSAAAGHQNLLEYLGVKALLDMGMRLGEGTGAALALPLLQCAVAMLSEMATFASASIPERSQS